MVILQNTDAHTLVGGYLPEFLNVDVIKILHSNGQLVRPISRWFPYRELHSGCTQLTILPHISGSITRYSDNDCIASEMNGLATRCRPNGTPAR